MVGYLQKVINYQLFYMKHKTFILGARCFIERNEVVYPFMLKAVQGML